MMREIRDAAWSIRSKINERRIEHCAALTPEQVMTIIDLYDEVANSNKEALLTITLETETSIPKVKYQGTEITGKRNVYFEWETDTDVSGGLTYAIEHVETVGKYPATNRIERRVKAHACD